MTSSPAISRSVRPDATNRMTSTSLWVRPSGNASTRAATDSAFLEVPLNVPKVAACPAHWRLRQTRSAGLPALLGLRPCCALVASQHNRGRPRPSSKWWEAWSSSPIVWLNRPRTRSLEMPAIPRLWVASHWYCSRADESSPFITAANANPFRAANSKACKTVGVDNIESAADCAVSNRSTAPVIRAT